MKKMLNIENHSIEVNSSMGWIFIYREQFGHDILPDVLPLLDATLEILADIYTDDETIVEKVKDGLIDKVTITLSSLEMTTLVNMLWAMAKNADASVPEPQTWANQFDVFPLDTVATEVFTLLLESSVSSKNSKRLQEKMSEVRSSSMN